MSIVHNFQFKQYGKNEPDRKAESMASQLRGMCRSVRDYGPTMKPETLEELLLAATSLREQIAEIIGEHHG